MKLEGKVAERSGTRSGGWTRLKNSMGGFDARTKTMFLQNRASPKPKGWPHMELLLLQTVLLSLLGEKEHEPLSCPQAARTMVVPNKPWDSWHQGQGGVW